MSPPLSKRAFIIETLRKRYRQHIPYGVRRGFCQSKTWLKDKREGIVFASANMNLETATPCRCLTIEQRIMPSKTYDNKVHNLKLAAQLIEQVILQPNDVFSFTKVIKNPTTHRGFLNSRALVNGVLEQTEGGGLCQLSGLLYQLALQCQLTIVERHNHSMDIYTEETRFTPLGSDATIVYGFKDLRIRNQMASTLRFQFKFEHERILGSIYSTEILPTQTVRFVIVQHTPTKIVHTKTSDGRCLTISKYQ